MRQVILRRQPPAHPAIPPAILLAEIISNELMLSLPRAFRITLLAAIFGVKKDFENLSLNALQLPQYALPRVNHCMPDARANIVGVVDLKIPAIPPKSNPDIPAGTSVSNKSQLRVRGLGIDHRGEDSGVS